MRLVLEMWTLKFTIHNLYKDCWQIMLLFVDAFVSACPKQFS